MAARSSGNPAHSHRTPSHPNTPGSKSQANRHNVHELARVDDALPDPGSARSLTWTPQGGGSRDEQSGSGETCSGSGVGKSENEKRNRTRKHEMGK